MQLIAPIMAFILPFFLLKAAGIPITMSKYKEILKKVISTNALYRLFTDFKDADMKKMFFGGVRGRRAFSPAWLRIIVAPIQKSGSAPA